VIAIAIVGLNSGLRSGCTWREGCVGGNLDRGRVDAFDVAKGLENEGRLGIPGYVLAGCRWKQALVSTTRLPLSIRVPVVVVLEGKDIVVVMILIADVSALLLMIKDCRGKQTNKQTRVRL